MAVRVPVRPALLTWAIERSGQDRDALTRRFPKLPEWEDEQRQPTLKQLQGFARSTRTPLGYLLLPEPPVEEVPLPDFRTVRDADVRRPSPDLLDTISLCEQRQEWYRNYARSTGADPLSFVASANTDAAPTDVATEMRRVLDFEVEDRSEFGSWSDALRGLRDHAEGAGVLVMISGIVGSNTHRKLDPDEFRGFTLVDTIAPVVFINGSDSKAAQIFTLAHEFAHVWLGRSALDNPQLGRQEPVDTPGLAGGSVERWCNEVAAEFLVPQESLRQRFDSRAHLGDEVGRLARFYRVSSLVALRSIFDAGLLEARAFWQAWGEELERIQDVRTSDGGDFYRTQPVRVSRRFAQAVITSTLEGHTSFTEAFRMLGFRKQSTFDELSHQLDVA